MVVVAPHVQAPDHVTHAVCCCVSCNQDSPIIVRLAGPAGYPLRTSAVLPCGALTALAPCTTRPLTTIGGEDSF